MENTQTVQSSLPDHVYQEAANLLLANKLKPSEAIHALTSTGVSGDDAKTVVETLHGQIIQLKKERANKDMLYGALWCAGGTVATLANIGFIFWGAILFGGIQLIRGIIQYTAVRQQASSPIH